MTKEYGDFQTDIKLCEQVCKLLQDMGLNPEIIIEPTCGKGNFIFSSIKTFKDLKKIIGIEIQKAHIQECQKHIKELKSTSHIPQVELKQRDIFTYSFEKEICEKKEILLIGNPPWVTNSELDGKNLPKKSNFKRTAGLDAITGKSNFDISEFIMLHLMQKFNGFNANLAFLCKTQVARNLLQFLPSTNIQASDFRIYLFDAKKEFNASVDACLFFCKLKDNNKKFQCAVFDLNYPNIGKKKFGWFGNKFVSDIEKYQKTKMLEGNSHLVWRSGIKHDCANIMELNSHGKILKNKLNEVVKIEEELIYPLIKSSDIKQHIINKTDKYIIVTQKKPGQDTKYISEKMPGTWKYLIKNKQHFEKRKSIIYRNNPLFSIFGVGDYSFKPYKIVISGLYKQPKFALLLPIEGKPVMVDDSCYTLSFSNLRPALIILAALNSELVREFLNSICFSDAKRPYKKDNLMRIDLLKTLNELKYDFIYKSISALSFENITDIDFLKVQDLLHSHNTEISLIP